MFYAIITNTADTQCIQFFNASEEQVMLKFESDLEELKVIDSPFVVMLVDQNEMTQASLVSVNEAGLVFDSTVVYIRYVDSFLELDETNYLLHA